MSRLLHQLALGHPAVGKISFDIEKSLLHAEYENYREATPVFVCGLARAGTTLIMRRLYDTGVFRSLTYRDMPFVLMPNLWQRIISTHHRKSIARQRAHGDALSVDFDSPEALEEIFWRVFCGEEYVEKNRLIAMTAGEDVIEKFREYIAIVMYASEGKKYLAKNNNHILRLSSIRAAFPKATLLIPFRRPIQQADSLLHQHERFLDADPFTQKYMSWLAHHEFGATHRPFVFAGMKSRYTDTTDLNYWLERWVQAYTWFLNQTKSHLLFVSYEMFCLESQKVWDALTNRLALPPTPETTDTIQFRERKTAARIDRELMVEASDIYDRLHERMVTDWLHG